MITIYEKNTQLLLCYRADRGDAQWVDAKLKQDGFVTIRKVFRFPLKNLIQEKMGLTDEDDSRTFLLGLLENDCFRIDKEILGLEHDLFLSKKMQINAKTFIAERDISIFRKIDRLINEQIVVGGDVENSIPTDEFEFLLKNFPTSTELTHYSNARITRVLKEYLGTMSDAQTKLTNYLSKRPAVKVASRTKFIQEYEVKKYEYVKDSLIEMLQDSDPPKESDWQEIILEFLLLIFPKYVAILPNLHIKDFYSKPGKQSDRYIDLTLIDANGNIDIVEIKRPFENCLLYTNKYRGNFTPKKELSGSVMQVEKYLFHLNKWGNTGEKAINAKRESELPNNLRVQITNPKGLILLGRDADFEGDQRFDFEIIRRQYANIIDIMTYDDLLRRLDNIISKFTK